MTMKVSKKEAGKWQEQSLLLNSKEEKVAVNFVMLTQGCQSSG